MTDKIKNGLVKTYRKSKDSALIYHFPKIHYRNSRENTKDLLYFWDGFPQKATTAKITAIENEAGKISSSGEEKKDQTK